MNPRIKSKTKFGHYTTTDIARSIIATNSLHLCKMSNMNDKTEAEKHLEYDNRLFTTCFSHSKAKSIPMFYLYSGIDGKGCRLEFTDTNIRRLINGRVHPVNKKYIKLNKTYDLNEYEILYDWIYYTADGGDTCYRDKWYKGDAVENIKQYKRDLFVKKPYWSYESEFRIMVKFNKDIEYDRIAIDFDFYKNRNGISILFGPELTESEYDELKKEFQEYGIEKCRKFTGNKISMGLAERNKKSLR